MRRGFKRIQQRGSETGGIVYISIQAALSGSDRTIDSAMFDRIVQQECERLFRNCQICGNPERAIGVEIGGHHHAIPTREYVVIPLRLHPLLAYGKQLHPGRLQHILRFGIEPSRTEPIQHTLTFKISALRYPIEPTELLAHFGPEHRDNLSRLPDEVASLMPFTVGILRRKERPVRMRELTMYKLQCFFHNFTKSILFGESPSIEVDPHQLRVVIEHLLEMGNQPLAIHGVSMEPATEMIVDPSGCHGSQL